MINIENCFYIDLKENGNMREEFFRAHGHKCAICGREELITKSEADNLEKSLRQRYHKPLTRKEADELKQAVQDIKDRIAHIDHDVPVSRGGSNHVSNLRLLCGPCNRRKGNLTTEEYKDKIKKAAEVDGLKDKVADILGIDKEFICSITRGRNARDVHSFLSAIIALGKEADK